MCRTSRASVAIESQMPRRKRVCFSSSPAVVIEYVPSRSSLSMDEHCSIWWNQDDIDEFCQTAVKNSTDTMRHKLLMDGLDRALQNSRQQHLLKLLQKKQQGDKQQQQDEEELIDEFLRTVPEDRGLTLWCRFGHSRRGLERVCSRLHFESRAYAAEKARAEVIRRVAADADAPITMDAEELRQVSERHTLFAKVFARIIAEADAIAARSIDMFDTGVTQSLPRKQQRRNTQPAYSGSGGGGDVPPMIMIPTLLKNKSKRRWSA